MAKPLGGRGKKAPYETVQVRVPLPIKANVEKLIAAYRDRILNDSEDDFEDTEIEEFLSALILVDRFIEEIEQTDHLYDKTRRNNINLARFRDWLISGSEEED